ncbi:hypothetical protein ADICEAN_03254 [Cesiribacter andamanensis AMV16]|uniref:PEP-CTERM system TPR-repeat lipoprotein n=2 Tax=Cesiribacter TaxID=1133570 RepID=M7N2W6_9BACT|nr:hypothetical protein ADICEAN_03254 [Cesiribacter andamanensis AMV16]
MRGDVQAGFYQAMALAEGGRGEEAAEHWINLPDTALSPSLRQKKTQALLALSNNSLEGMPQAEALAGIRLRLRSGSLIPAEINALLSMLSEQERTQAQLHLARQALNRGSAEEAVPYLAPLQQARLGEAHQQQLHLLLLQQQLLSGKPSRQPAAAGSDPFARQKEAALRRLAAGDTVAALQQLRQLTRLTPFEEDALLLSASLHNARQETEDAYELLRQALLLNRYSIPLLEAYALQSLRMGLENYAQDALLELEISSPSERHSRFLTRYEALRESLPGAAGW